MTEEHRESFTYRQFNATVVEMAIHVGFVGLLAYWTFVLVSPFLPIIVWSVVLAVAPYPIYDWLAAALGWRGWLAAKWRRRLFRVASTQGSFVAMRRSAPPGGLPL
jgi:hypothetical protein